LGVIFNVVFTTEYLYMQLYTAPRQQSLRGLIKYLDLYSAMPAINVQSLFAVSIHVVSLYLWMRCVLVNLVTASPLHRNHLIGILSGYSYEITRNTTKLCECIDSIDH